MKYAHTMLVLVTGATGFLGKHLTRRLAKTPGIEVRAVTRNPARGRAADWGKNVDVHLWREEWTPFPKQALEGVEAVIHLMGENIGDSRWTAEKKKRILESRTLSTRQLVDALHSSVHTFICASAIGIYPSDPEQAYDESTPLPKPSRNDSFLRHVCIEWEKAAARASTQGRRVIHLRTGLVLGKEGGALAELLPIFKSGLAGPIAGGLQWMSWIHQEDWTSLVLHCLQHKSLEGPVNLVSPNPLRQKEFATLLGKALHRPAIVPTPKLALKAMLGERGQLALDSERVLPKKALASGFKFQYADPTEAFEDLL